MIMRRSSLVQVITADALRATIRAVGLLAECRAPALSVPRGLLAVNAVAGLRRELGRLRGLGDLLAPVSTVAEVEQRTGRLQQLAELLPETPGLRDAAQQLVLSAGQAPVSAALRGELLAAEERSLQALEERLKRTLAAAGHEQSEGLTVAMGLIHAESASWRGLEDSWLANRLIADRGFVDTWSQARKRARALVKARAGGASVRFKPAQLRDFERWHQSVAVQLQVLAGSQAPGVELAQLRDGLTELGDELGKLLLLTRLRRAVTTVKQFDEALIETSDRLVACLQRGYGVGKSNFRTLIESELA